MRLYDVMRKEEGKVLERREKETHEPMTPLPKERFVFTRKKLLLIAGAALFVVALYVVGINMVSAKIIVTERRIPFSLAGAELQLANQEKADSERLSFQAMVVDTTITREVYGSALTNSNTKARGTVVFFNEYSTAKQTVKKGTTLTGANGKKYVTQAQVVVPGYTTVNKKKVAGTSPSVEVVAADVGTSYNTTGTTLSVSGWGNASKTFYGRSAAISGGEAGVSHTLTEAEREQVVATLTTQLVERLKRETRAQIPEGYITFPELQLPIIDTKSLVFKGGSVRFPASMSGTMVTYLIPQDLFEQAVAAKAVSDQSYAGVAIPDVGDLVVDLRTAIPTDPKVVPDEVIVSVSGAGTIIAKVPIDKVKQAMLGRPRRTFEEAMAPLPEIEIAKFRLFPFWSPRFPSKWTKIDVITK